MSVAPGSRLGRSPETLVAAPRRSRDGGQGLELE